MLSEVLLQVRARPPQLRILQHHISSPAIAWGVQQEPKAIEYQ